VAINSYYYGKQSWKLEEASQLFLLFILCFLRFCLFLLFLYFLILLFGLEFFLNDLDFHTFCLFRLISSRFVPYNCRFDSSSKLLLFLFGQLPGLLIGIFYNIKEAIRVNEHGFSNNGEVLIHGEPLEI
jgi:hypothetical protein